MKSIIILYILILLCQITQGQITTKDELSASINKLYGPAERPEVVKYKEETVTDRKEFYAAKTIYDPATEYESLFNQGVSQGLGKKAETGVVKIIDDNNKTQIAYYNNAPIGTILKLNYGATGKSTYVIVVGKIPPTENNTYLLLVSARAARNLGVKDYSTLELACFINQ